MLSKTLATIRRFLGDKEIFFKYISLFVDIFLLFFVCIFLYKLSKKEEKLGSKIQGSEKNKIKDKSFSPFKIFFSVFVFSGLFKIFIFILNHKKYN